MPTDPDLIAKIRKLAAMADVNSGATPNEAAQAAAHARRLMEEAGICEADLDAAGEHPAGELESVWLMAQFQTAEASIGQTVARMCDCVAVRSHFKQTQVHSRRGVKLYGRARNVAIAIELWRLFTAKMFQASRDWCAIAGHVMRSAEATDFREGWAAGFGEAANKVAKRDNAAALVRHSEALAYAHAEGPIKYSKVRAVDATDAAEAGYVEGLAVDARPHAHGIKARASTPLALPEGK